MPPSIIFTKGNIINSTFEIYKEIGFEKITARKIALKLGCSVAPIYSNFKNIDELKNCMMEKTLSILLEYTKKSYSNHIFLNIGLGILAFAKNYNELYRALFVNSNQYSYILDELFEKNLELMKQDKMLKDFSELEMKRVLEKLRLFTHGLAVFVCSGNMGDKSEAYLSELMKEAGEDMIGYAIYKKKKRDMEIKG